MTRHSLFSRAASCTAKHLNSQLAPWLDFPLCWGQCTLGQVDVVLASEQQLLGQEYAWKGRGDVGRDTERDRQMEGDRDRNRFFLLPTLN